MSYNISMSYREFFNKLEKHDVKYLTIGGIAVNLYGYPRVTGDIDVMISFDKENIDKL